MKKILHWLMTLTERAIRRILIIALIVVAGVVLFLLKLIYFPNLPKPIKVYDTAHINDPWTEADRQKFYHLSQGSEIMPYDWFIALEQPDNDQPFIAPENMARFRLLPDANTADNPDRLPVGFAKDFNDPVTHIDNLGITCAACHTSQLTYKGMGVRIEGAGGLVDFDAFVARLMQSIIVTSRFSVLDYLFPNRNSKFNRFARRVLKKDKITRDDVSDLKGKLRAWRDQQFKQQFQQLINAHQEESGNTNPGFGRIDALGAGGNTLYGRLTPSNLRALNAPVKVLPLWFASKYNWVQTNGSIREPLARNVIESLAVSANLVFPGNDNNRYVSSARLNNMSWLEEAIDKVPAPVWPENILGRLDQEKIKRGEPLYRQYCASCHEPQVEGVPEANDDIAKRNDKRYFVIKLFSYQDVGTDEMDARNFAERTLDATSIASLLSPPPADPKNVPGAEVIGLVLSGIIQRGYSDLPANEKPANYDRWVGYRANLLRACKAYPARPLAGVWATPPYLHNGSIPSLYQLLLPPAERAAKFQTGDAEFDTTEVGHLYKDEFEGSFTFDTTKTGNSNKGHDYGTSLTDGQRMDLIEYLKALKSPNLDQFPKGAWEVIAPQPDCPVGPSPSKALSQPSVPPEGMRPAEDSAKRAHHPGAG